jgi:hypothetical protein
MEQEFKEVLRGQVLHSSILEIGCWKAFAGKCATARFEPTSPHATLPAVTIVGIWRKFNLTKNEYLAMVVVSVCKSQTMGDHGTESQRASVCELMSSAARRPRLPDRSSETWRFGVGAS